MACALPVAYVRRAPGVAVRKPSRRHPRRHGQATRDVLVALTYASTSGWQPAPPPARPLDLLADDVGLCNQAYAMLEPPLNAATELDSLELADGNSQDVLRGCRLHATYGGNSDPADFIWRFGALLAVGDGAHKLLPQLPLAPAGEIAAVGG